MWHTIAAQYQGKNEVNDFERITNELGGGIIHLSYVWLLPRTHHSHSSRIIRFGRYTRDYFNQVPVVFNDHDVIISWCIILFGLWTKTQKQKYDYHFMDDDPFSFRCVSFFGVG